MIPTTSQFGPVPGWVILWIVFLLAVGLFVRRMIFLVRLLMLGRPEIRWDRIPERLKRVGIYVFAQLRMFDEPLVGIPHLLIFYGFLIFLLATTGMLVQGLFPSLALPSVEQNRYLAPVVDIFAVLVLGGLSVTSFRRFVLRPAGLQLTWDATLVNVLIASLMVTYLFATAFRLRAAGETQVWLPASAVLAGWLERPPALRASALTLFQTFWWMHLLIVLGFLAYLPYAKHLHLLAAPFSVLFSRLGPPGELPAPAPNAARLGAERL